MGDLLYRLIKTNKLDESDLKETIHCMNRIINYYDKIKSNNSPEKRLIKQVWTPDKPEIEVLEKTKKYGNVMYNFETEEITIREMRYLIMDNNCIIHTSNMSIGELRKYTNIDVGNYKKNVLSTIERKRKRKKIITNVVLLIMAYLMANGAVMLDKSSTNEPIPKVVWTVIFFSMEYIVVSLYNSLIEII